VCASVLRPFYPTQNSPLLESFPTAKCARTHDACCVVLGTAASEYNGVVIDPRVVVIVVLTHDKLPVDTDWPPAAIVATIRVPHVQSLCAIGCDSMVIVA